MQQKRTGEGKITKIFCFFIVFQFSLAFDEKSGEGGQKK